MSSTKTSISGINNAQVQNSTDDVSVALQECKGPSRRLPGGTRHSRCQLTRPEDLEH